MALFDYSIYPDHFRYEDPGHLQALGFPCCSCAYRQKADSEYPCSACGHNANCISGQDEQDGQDETTVSQEVDNDD